MTNNNDISQNNDMFANSNGIFTVGSSGTVKIDYLYDGGGYKGEIAIFSLQGMENLEVGSAEFVQEAARRAQTNSQQGYVVTQDESDRARFNGDAPWEGNYNSGEEYLGVQSFNMQAGDTFAILLVSDGKVADLVDDPNATETIFSFGTLNPETESVEAQMVDVTGNGNTFGFEDVNVVEGSDKDFNDVVLQVLGATTTASLLDDEIYVNRDWRTTESGQELISYANRPVFESGTFKVNATGQFTFDYLYDGGWFKGELAVFSLKGMEGYTPGSTEFIAEAARRALSNSSEGRVLIDDRNEGAKFSDKVAWENDFNSGDYQGMQSFEMTPGDELAFMLVQHTSVQELYRNPNDIFKWGKLPIFSIPEANPDGTAPNQIISVDDNGSFAFEDVRIDKGQSDLDYNDVIFQVRGLEGNNIAKLEDNINANRNWTETDTGKELLEYADRSFFNEGVFEVNETGQISFDYLFDGGWFKDGEVALFNLEGMEVFEAGSKAFIQEAARRAMSNSDQGYVVISDRNEGAKFSEKLAWENDFNFDPELYQGPQYYSFNPGDRFAVMLVQNTTVEDIAQNPDKTDRWGSKALFSLPEANPGGEKQGQLVDVNGTGTYGIEDLALNTGQADRDYNDVVFQIKGAEGVVASIDEFSNPERDWRNTTVGQELLEYANRATFDEGVFIVGESGEVNIDFLYDGGYYSNGQVGIFSLEGLDSLEIGSQAFTEEAIKRATSNSEQGYLIIDDAQEGARFNADLPWEGQSNNGEYEGTNTYQLNPGETVGIVFTPDGTLADSLTAPDWAIKRQPLFSMSAANEFNDPQVSQIGSSTAGTIIGLEDVRIDLGSNLDYNDIVFSIEGLQSVGLTSIEETINGSRDWLGTEVAQQIVNYFDIANSVI